jgi:ornithine decarboxylase
MGNRNYSNRSDGEFRDGWPHFNPVEQTPVLLIDLDQLRTNFAAIRRAFPRSMVYYAVKANPAPRLLAALVALGSRFDVASPGEVRACLQAGADPGTLSYTNTVKKSSDIALAHRLGVRLYTADSPDEIDKIGEHAPGGGVFVRIHVDNDGAAAMFGSKFGCEPQLAAGLLRRAQQRGLTPMGISFHVGSQQTDLSAWDRAIGLAARCYHELAPDICLPTINLGGGLPATYTQCVPGLSEYAAAIDDSLARHFGHQQPAVILEPGRAIAASAGTIVTEVVQVSHRHGQRWVYLDVGRYGGLAETEGEAIIYPVIARSGDPTTGPVVLAGPSADGDDVLYHRHQPELPLSLAAGDLLDIRCTGAYTATYSSIFFNGLGPLRVIVTDSKQAA